MIVTRIAALGCCFVVNTVGVTAEPYGVDRSDIIVVARVLGPAVYEKRLLSYEDGTVVLDVEAALPPAGGSRGNPLPPEFQIAPATWVPLVRFETVLVLKGNPGSVFFTNGTINIRETLWNTNTGPVDLVASNAVFAVTSLSNVFANPLLTSIGYTTNGYLDPRPQTGSPALTSTITAPNDGFYTPVTYKGAFDRTNLWVRGWTALDSYGILSTNNPVVVVPPTAPTITTVAGSGTLSFSITSQNGYSYLLQATPVLTPPAWTTVETLPGNGGVLNFTPVATTNTMEYFRILAQ